MQRMLRSVVVAFVIAAFHAGMGAAQEKPVTVASGESLGKELARGWTLQRQELSKAKDHGMRIASAPEPVRAGEKSLRIELRRGDCGQDPYGEKWDDCWHGNERVELRSVESDWFKPNTRGEYGWSIYLPEDWDLSDPSTVIMGQFHQDGGPPAFQFFHQSQLGGLQVTRKFENRMGTDTRTIIPPDELRGRWHDIRVEAYWRKKKDGFFKVFVDGKPAYDFKGQTMSGKRIIFKLGIYRLGPGLKAPTLVTYYDDIWRK